MSVLVGPFTIACALLVVGGIAKTVRPSDTVHALREIGVPHARMFVPIGGLTETLVGACALAVGGQVFASLVAVSYLGFAIFVVVALRSGAAISSCGCFGKVDTPPSLVHVVIDLVFALVAAAVVSTSASVALLDTLRDQPLLGVPFVLLVAIGSFLVFVSFTALPKTLSIARAVRATRA